MQTNVDKCFLGFFFSSSPPHQKKNCVYRRSDAKLSQTSSKILLDAGATHFQKEGAFGNVKSVKQVVVFVGSLALYLHLSLSLPPSLPLALTPLPLSPSSLGRIKGWGRGSLCRLCWDL